VKWKKKKKESDSCAYKRQCIKRVCVCVYKRQCTMRVCVCVQT